MSISFIETKDQKDFPEHKELFSLIENFMGYLPHAFLLMADNPNLLNAFSGLSNEIFSSDEIDNQTKQLIALASSLSSGCKYCQSHTSHGEVRAGVSVEKILSILDYQNSKHLWLSPMFNVQPLLLMTNMIYKHRPFACTCF